MRKPPCRGGRYNRGNSDRRVSYHVHEHTLSEATREALRSRSRRRPRPRILASGVMEYWSVVVLRILRIAPRERGVEATQGVFINRLTRA
jgi:hypothetical protein